MLSKHWKGLVFVSVVFSAMAGSAIHGISHAEQYAQADKARAAERTVQETEDFVANIQYFKDNRTGLVFATVGNSTFIIPEEKVPVSLLRVSHLTAGNK